MNPGGARLLTRVQLDKFSNNSLQDFRNWILDNYVTQEDLKKISQFVNRVRNERFKKNAIEYRGIDRTFKDDEIKMFFEAADNIKYRVLFLFLWFFVLSCFY